jgi:NAD(P)-dependent dehydrogenase (short-subunit alcohol dehydrogenase family)
MAKNWFITGTSRGFGREWATAALERGDRVAATARNTETLNDLVAKFGDHILPLTLDVTSKKDATRAVNEAHEKLGRLDVVVNNAGFGLFGMIEEVSEKEARDQIETNVFGALWITQAALPHLRAQKSGHILQVSSIGGITSFPSLGLYHASKWALEGFSQSLAIEVAGFGIRVTIVEPGGYETDWNGSSAVRSAAMPEYAELRQKVNEWRRSTVGKRGNARASAKAILKLVDAKDPPLRLFLGEAPLGIARAEYKERLATWEAWDALSKEAQGD